MLTIKIMVGPSNSGKTTYINEHMNIFSDTAFHRDEYRKRMVGDRQWTKKLENEVYAAFVNDINDKIWYYLGCGIETHTIWIDQTSLYPNVRKKLLDNLDYDESRMCVKFIYIQNELETSLKWNHEERNDEIPKKVIEEHYRTFCPITKEELKRYEADYGIPFSLVTYHRYMKNYDCSKVLDYFAVYDLYCNEVNDCGKCELGDSLYGCTTRPTEEKIRILQEWADNHSQSAKIKSALETCLKEEYNVTPTDNKNEFLIKKTGI